MSDIQYSINVSATKGAFSESIIAGGVTAAQNSAGMLAVTLQLGTATATISTASAGALGFAFAQNLSTSTVTTDTVSFGRLDGTTLYEAVTLRPGEAAWARLAAGDYGAKAGTENVPLLLQILED